MSNLICLDRDGTLVYDNKCNLGSQYDWKKKVKILPHVIKGIKELNKIPNTKIYIITNQPAVAVKELKLLTKKRAYEVCKYIFNKINKQGAHLDGYFICTGASKEYAKSHPEYTLDKSKLDNCNCMKPKPGMVLKALKKSKFKKPKIYVIGDRASDVQTAKNVKGTGILVPYKNEPGQKAKLSGKKIIKKNFLEAVKFIKNYNSKTE
jgi:D-glycero-D-manno-heptose 1,7-bisphosphate phosphatase